MVNRLVSFVAVGSVLVACGSSSDDKPAGTPGTTNKQAATSTTQTVVTAVTGLFSTSAGADKGFASANQLGAAANQTQSIVTAGAPGTQAAALTAISEAIKTQGNPQGFTGTCDCTETSCTFNACKGPTIQIDGTYSWGGGKLKCSGLKYVYAGAATMALYTVTATLDCDMTITSTSMDGTLKTSGSSSLQQGAVVGGTSWENTITFKQVTFAATGGAPTGGSETVTGTYTVNAGGQKQVYNGSLDITFP